MVKATGVGKILDTTLTDPSVGRIQARLYNFDISGDVPKKEHFDFLADRVFPLLAHGRGSIWMQGIASQSGSNAFNMALSRKRAENVADILRFMGTHDLQMQTDAIGEEFSTSVVKEDEFERAVALVVLPIPPKKKDKPPKRVPPAPPVKAKTKSFHIKMHMEISGGVFKFISAQYNIFEIFDDAARRTAFYKFTAAGVARGIGGVVSATTGGPWNPFKTTGALAANEFGGPVLWTTAGGAHMSVNTIRFQDLPSRITTLPNPVRMDTGFTFGLGIAAVEGKFELLFPELDGGLWPGTM